MPIAPRTARHPGRHLHLPSARRLLGAWAGGWAFILPNFVIVAAPGALYVHLGDLPSVTAVFYGVSPAVIALILHSCYRLAKLGMEDRLQWALAVICFFVGYLVHNRALPWWRSVDALALFLFTLPGTVIGIGLISLWNRPATNAVYATPAIIILGYLAQYAFIPMRMMAASLQRIPPSLERAAELSGASWFMTLRTIVAPLAKRGLTATWIIAYVFCLRDVGITMVVYPPGSDTLPIRTLTLMANGAPSLISALCVILIMVILLPLVGAALWQIHAERST
jgi:ABC-type spermidine/putrescine transport system permease subunit II